MSVMISSTPILISVFYYYPTLRLYILSYIFWIFYDQDAIKTGRSFPKMKKFYWSLPFWNGMAAYFPAKLVKTHDLDPKKKYVFGFGPHGLYGLSLVSIVYGLDQWSKLFPGIDLLGITLPINFWVPIWRDLILCIGVGDSNANSIRYRINQGPPGTSMVIAVGGQREFRLMKPGHMDLVIKSRKGFVKIALQTGASLVPILSFGENELYHSIENKVIKEGLNSVFYALFRASAPLVVGRFYSIFPCRHPVFVVVGKPVEVIKKIENPTQKEIDETHAKYLDGLRELYDSVKDDFHQYRVKEMEFH